MEGLSAFAGSTAANLRRNGKISDYGNEVREDILTAKDDAGDKVQTAVEFAESKMPAARSIFKKRK